MKQTLNLRQQLSIHSRYCYSSSTGVPNLGYMYPWGYICLSEGVHLRLAIEGKNIFTCCLFSNIYTYSLNIIFKSHYMFIVKYICDKS